MPMSELIKCVYDYRNLLGRRDLLRMHLDAEEKHRLESLDQLLEWRPEEGGPSTFPLALRRKFSRFDMRIPATVRVGRGDSAAPIVIVNMGGGGVVVEPAPSLRRGELTVVKIKCSALGREFHFPAQAKWLSESLNRSSMGLAFVGIPIELRYGVGRSASIADAA
jgi:hypothetical protein